MTSVEAKTNYTASSSFPDLSTKTSRKWQWQLQEVFGDLRVRSGIKFGLAALLALYVAEVLRLQHPNWSILTVLGMMSVPYVGSITILAITQVAGTIAGALVGYIPRKQNVALSQFIEQAGELMAMDSAETPQKAITVKFVRSPNSAFPQVEV